MDLETVYIITDDFVYQERIEIKKGTLVRKSNPLNKTYQVLNVIENKTLYKGTLPLNFMYCNEIHTSLLKPLVTDVKNSAGSTNVVFKQYVLAHLTNESENVKTAVKFNTIFKGFVQAATTIIPTIHFTVYNHYLYAVNPLFTEIHKTSYLTFNNNDVSTTIERSPAESRGKFRLEDGTSQTPIEGGHTGNSYQAFRSKCCFASGTIEGSVFRS
jgi:hypothetical protein